MYKKGLLFSVVLIFGLAVGPGLVSGEITGASASDTTIDGGTSQGHTITISDDGNSTGYSVDVSDAPAGVDVSEPSGSSSGGGNNQDISITIDADADADSGTVRGDVNGEDFRFDVDVITPPRPGFEDEPYDAGDVLVDDVTSGQLTVEEVSGSGTTEGVRYDIIDSPAGASLDFPSGLQYGSSTWEIDVGNADQHETLTWTIELWDDGDKSVSREVDLEARVIYPGYIESASLADNDIEFDEPKESTQSIEDDISVDVENGGDLPLEVSSVRASSGASGISVTRTGSGEINADSTEEIDIEVSADTDLSEGDYSLSGSVDTANGGSDDFSGDISISHNTRLSASSVSVGDVPIGQSQSSSTTITEDLGYKGVDNIQLQQQSGPNSWISVTSQPGSVSAGGETSASFNIAFDAEADPGSTYEWVYSTEGSTSDTQVRVTATPVPLDMEPIQESLSGYDSSVASQTLTLVNDMDQQIRSGAAQRGQISTTLAFADSAEIYMESINEASNLINEDRHVQAQPQVMRAASAYNTLQLYSNEFQSSQLRSTSNSVLSEASGDLESVISEQQEYYQAQIQSGELTHLEETRAKRQLAEIERFNGNSEEADRLEAEADSSFEEYVSAVSDAETQVQEGERAWETIQDNGLTLLGQPLLINPMKYGTYSSQIEQVRQSYEGAISNLQSAGATNRLSTVSSTYDFRSLGLLIAQGSLLVAIVVYIGGAGGLIYRTVSQMYQYSKDAEEVTSGDFLLN